MPRFTLDGPVKRTLTITDLLGLVRTDYDVRRLRSRGTIVFPMRHVARALGDRPAHLVSEDDLHGYVLARREAGAAESSIRTELALLHRGYTLAIQHRMLRAGDKPAFPVIGVDRLKVRRGWLREEQVHAIMARLDGDTADLVEFLYVTSWRVGEARSLLWEWIDAEEIYLPTSKSGHPRVIPNAGEIAEVIERRQKRRLGPYVFHRNGRPIGDFMKQWHRAVREAGLEGRIVHDLRRSAMKRMIEGGLSLKTAMAFSGHRTMHTALRYHIVDLSDMREATEELRRRRYERAEPSWWHRREERRTGVRRET